VYSYPNPAVYTHPPSTPTTTFTITPSTTYPVPTASGCAANSPPAGVGKVRFAGVNIAGFDFGMNTDGEQGASAAYPPLVQYYGPDGQGQMDHFAGSDGLNIFRLPVGWQYLTNGVLGGEINLDNWEVYEALVQACLATGAHCIVDVHNYARWQGGIIGQGGPSNAEFAALWTSLATIYAGTENIIFGVMNEPHDLDIPTWAETVQVAVTAIREAGATSQMVLLPASNYTSAQQFVSTGAGDLLRAITNPDGTTTNLIFDVHKYLDSDNSGTHPACVTDNIAEAWAPLAQWLRCHGRQALNTETGGGPNDPSCPSLLCSQFNFMNQNSDVFLGWVGWAAGAFTTYSDYVLLETPSETSPGVWVDQPLVAQCIVGMFDGSTVVVDTES